MPADTHFWFPAKRYGWGWGLPVKWQGWAVFVAYVVLVAASCCWFPAHLYALQLITSVATLTFVLLLICWAKGEPPRWRWGK